MTVYGSDISTFQASGAVDVDPSLATHDGARVILELCARRLMTPRGFLEDAPDAGYDLMGQMAARMSPLKRQRMRADIRAELIRVQGVLDVVVADFVDLGGGAWRIPISVRLAEGPFSLVLQASNLDVALIRADKG